MNSTTLIQRIIDQLMYNQLYAPDYPAEDRTTLQHQETSINEQLTQASSAAAKLEHVGDWLRLGGQSITVAFECYRKGDERSARKNVEAAIEYFRNASSKKPHKANFTTTSDGSTKPTS